MSPIRNSGDNAALDRDFLQRLVGLPINPKYCNNTRPYTLGRGGRRLHSIPGERHERVPERYETGSLQQRVRDAWGVEYLPKERDPPKGIQNPAYQQRTISPTLTTICLLYTPKQE